jgi:hypothetical protein
MKLDAIRGGVNTVKERVQLNGQFSTLNNYRQRHSGIEQRKGQKEHTTTADASTEIISLYQFSKGKQIERHLYAQYIDGSVQEATNEPPTTGTTFGSDVLAAVANPVPASWNIAQDMLFFSDGVRQHQVFSGDQQRIDAFIVYKGTAAIPRIPVNGEDYTLEVGDGVTTTEAVLDSLSTLAAFDAIFIMTKEPMQDLNFTVSAANGNAAVMQVKYWDGAFTAVSGFSDGTVVSAKTFAQSGAMTWTKPTDELPTYMFGKSGFWYQLSLSSGSLDADTKVSACTYDGAWQEIRNVWDGILVDAIEAQVYRTSTAGYQVFGGASVSLNRMTTSDHCYFSATDRIFGFYADVGSNPNIRKAVYTGSTNVTFEDGGDNDDSILFQDANPIELGFEKGMEIDITGTTNNNNTMQILQVTNNRVYVQTGELTAEADQSATITADNNASATVDLVEVWTGSGWTSLATSLEDGTDGLSKSGFITWDRTAATPQLTQFNESQYRAYWYRLSLDKETSNNVNISIQTMPYYDLDSFGKIGISNGVWKSRNIYIWDQFPQFLYLTAIDKPFALNGDDFGILEAGDGRSNRVVAGRNFYSDYMVFQEEKGVRGGTVTIFNGYSPTTFGRFQLSTNVGAMNSKCVEVVNGVRTSTETEEKIVKIVAFLSREGVMITDGTAIYAISDDIQNYFDPTKAESIRLGYEDKMWLVQDKVDNVLRIGLVSGGSATVPNIFPVYDLVDGTFSFDTLGQALSHMTNVEAASGDVPILQVGGGASAGKVYQLNQTDDDVSTAIDAEAVLEIDRNGEKDILLEMGIRMKAIDGGTLTVTDAVEGNTVYGNSRGISMSAETANDTYKRDSAAITNLHGSHFSIKMRNNEEGIRPYLFDVGFKSRDVENNT